MPAPKAVGAAIRSRSLVPGYHTSTATRFCAEDAVPGPATTVDGRAGARRRRQHVPRGLPLDGGVSGAWLRCGTRTSASGSSSPYSAGLRWTATRNGPASPTIRYDKKISTAYMGWFVVSGAHARQLQRLIGGRERERVYGYLWGVPRASSCEKISPRGLLSAELRCARCRRQLARGEPARDRRSRRRQHTGQLRGRAASKMYGRHGSSMIVLGCVLEGSDMAHQRALGAELAPPWLRPAAETTASGAAAAVDRARNLRRCVGKRAHRPLGVVKSNITYVQAALWPASLFISPAYLSSRCWASSTSCCRPALFHFSGSCPSAPRAP